MRIVTDNDEVAALPHAQRIATDADAYASAMRGARVGVVPCYDGGEDLGILWEYALCGVVPLAGPAATLDGLTLRGNGAWTAALHSILSDDGRRIRLAHALVQQARAHAATRGCASWWSTLAKGCVTTVAH